MNNNDLIERYVYAVTKNMSSKIRHDIANEIRSIIDDMLEEQCRDITPTEQDIRVVLTKLGTPCELEDKYNQDSIKCLIGGSHYIQYKSLLKTVLPCVVFGLTIAVPIITVTLQTVWYMALLK